MHRASVETIYLEGLELWDQILRVRRLGSTSAKCEDRAPSASLDHPRAQAAPTHPGAQRRQLEGLPWPQQPASGRPKVEDSPLSTNRHCSVNSLHLHIVDEDHLGPSYATMTFKNLEIDIVIEAFEREIKEATVLVQTDA